MVTQPKRRLFDVGEYYAMSDAGILAPDDRVELLDGEIIQMPPIGVNHASCTNRMTHMLVTRFGERAVVSVQNPVRLDAYTELQPDFMLLDKREDYYSTGHPGPEDVLLLVEVSDSTVGFDRGAKLRRYARAGIREVWIVNLPSQVVEVYSEPDGSAYGSSSVVGIDGELAPGAFGDAAVSVSEILSKLEAPDEVEEPS